MMAMMMIIIIIIDNELDGIIRDNEKRTWLLKDTAISLERSAVKKEAEKILKYKKFLQQKDSECGK